MIIDNTKELSSTAFKAPVPGQSLTSDPSNPMPWETPPEIVEVEDAVLAVIHPLVTVDETLNEFIRLAEGGVPLEHFVTMFTFGGFKAGKWTPDIMMLMQEPVLYYLIAICEKAEIAYNLDEEDMERTMQDPEYRYSSDPELEEEVSALTEEKLPEVVDEKVLTNIAPPSGGLMSPTTEMTMEEV